MADDAIAESFVVELEAKRKADCSWHPCQVSLCPGGGLSVKFEGQVLEELILSVEDAFAYLRVRSIPLQGDDCCYIEEGKYVLAACESNSQKLFFDAVMQKEDQRSPVVYGLLESLLSVFTKQKELAVFCVNWKYYIVQTIRVRHSKRASCRCTFMIKWLSEHAEKGISSIPSNSVMKLSTERINAHPVVAAFLDSMERSYLSTSSVSYPAFDDTENEVDLHGLLKQIEGIGSLTNASKKELLKDSILDVNHGGRCDQTKLVSLEQKSNCSQVSHGRSPLRRSARRQNILEPTFEPSTPSSDEKSVQSQSPLNPLASRAVLASLVSKLPQNVESVPYEEREHAPVSDSCPSVQFSEDYSVRVVNKMESLVTKERASSGKKLHAQKSNGLIKEICNNIEPSIDSRSILSSLVRDEESTLPVVTSRLTRSAMKRGSSNAIQDDDPVSVEDAIVVRVTRSATQKGKGTLADKPSEELLRDRVISTCSAPIKDMEIPDVEDKSRTADEVTKRTILSSATRVTRSAARAGTGILDGRAKEPLQVKPETESSQPHYYNSDYKAVMSTKKRTFPHINAELKSAQSDKKQKDLNAIVEDLHGNVIILSQKEPISSKNQPSRFSPHSRSSRRTRSHDQFNS